MSMIADVFAIMRGIGTLFLRMRVHKKWVKVANQLDVPIQYPAHIYGDVGDVWISAKIANTDHGMGPAVIFLESSPNTPLPDGVEPDSLCDVILEPKCDEKTLLKEMGKLLDKATILRQRAIDEDGFIE